MQTTPPLRSAASLLSLLLLAGACRDEEKKPDPQQEEEIPQPVSMAPGAPSAGVAEAPIDFPVGSPMGGYSNRCDYLGGAGEADKRLSPYALAFTPSAGMQTRPMAKALWLENGDQHVVYLKADVIYAYDNLVEEIEDRLADATGEEMDGRVLLTTSHSHNAPANYSDQIHFYLGGDRYNEEIFQRFATSLEAVALEAYDGRVPAQLGVGIARDWDPDDRVYGDRREINDEAWFWDDQAEPGYGKDPHLWMLRVDDLDGVPLGMFFTFGIHGTSLGASNPMISVDSTGHIEQAVQQRFDRPVVVAHWQGAGGDASPRGVYSGHEYANMESIGELAVDAVMALWEQTPTSSAELTVETVGRSVQQSLDQIKVTRDGAADLRYADYDPDEEFAPDDEIYAADGSILSPIDEFNALYGGVFCGYDDPLISAGTIGSDVYPYDGCMNVELISFVINGIFELGEFWEGGEAPLPLPDSQQAGTAATLLSPVAIRNPDGSETTGDFLMGFFPGEITATYTEQFRRRAEAELGIPQAHAMAVGYAQDHEGYLMIPEDWLLGGYEPNINMWGPLQGEHIMEGVLEMAESHLLTLDLREPHDPHKEFQPTTYPDRPLPELAPEETPTAGTFPTSAPDYLYTPLSLAPSVQPPAEVPRAQGAAQLIWEGGDAGVDTPLVVLERQTDGGAWEEVLTPSGRPVTDALADILLTYTPDPLYPYTDPQTHYWYASWQAVGPAGSDRLGLEEGVYRLHVYGEAYSGGASTWPWPSDPYEVTSDPFAVVPAALSVRVEADAVVASLPGPSWGWRLLALGGTSSGANPITDGTVTWIFEDGSVEVDAAVGEAAGSETRFVAAAPEGAVAVEVMDAFGNAGQIEL